MLTVYSKITQNGATFPAVEPKTDVLTSRLPNTGADFTAGSNYSS